MLYAIFKNPKATLLLTCSILRPECSDDYPSKIWHHATADQMSVHYYGWTKSSYSRGESFSQCLVPKCLLLYIIQRSTSSRYSRSSGTMSPVPGVYIHAVKAGQWIEVERGNESELMC